MTDETSSQLKPQDTIIFLLGEMKAELRGLREGQTAAVVRDAVSDAKNTKEHDEFRKSLNDHANDLLILKGDRNAARELITGNRFSAPTRVGLWLAGVGMFATLAFNVFRIIHP